ncbi:hypothetical protein [Maricaulis sp.]|uniref:hypothetical protein n=1 Tax=Maricaulis sp. TaxID=1486257 RepID=UPI0025BDDF1D|nr:hypothetical protein [Maricaulis sp.]
MLDLEYLAASYRALGLQVIADPFSPDVVAPLVSALRAGAPYLLVRMGDGEMNFLSYGAQAGTPTLDKVVLKQAVMMCEDRFQVSDAWLPLLRDAMVASVEAADMVGVVGLWRPCPTTAAEMAERCIGKLRASVRAMSGHWRSIAAMFDYARTGALDGKVIGPAHAYFGVARHMPELIAAAQRVLCISNRPLGVKRLGALHPGRTIDLLALNADPVPLSELPDSPDFLQAVEDRLDPDLSGTLVLIGAGPWAEFYGEMVRKRNGVAIDFGSAFDLLEGTLSRPVHKHYLGRRGLEPADLFG